MAIAKELLRNPLRAKAPRAFYHRMTQKYTENPPNRTAGRIPEYQSIKWAGYQNIRISEQRNRTE
jgi:hypothetical protein